MINSADTSRAGGKLLVDTHVHIYPSFNLGKLLAGFELRAKHYVGPQGIEGLLCLVDRNGTEMFPRLTAMAANQEPAGEFEILPTEDPYIVRAQREGFRVHVLNGKQWSTKERIEVLGLGADISIADGESVDHVIELLRRNGALPVIPWSPGKWMGARGRIIDDLLYRFEPGVIAFGDIYMRPNLFPETHFKKCHERGFAILAGGDPLPICGEECVVGEFGILASIPERISRTSFVELLRRPCPDWKTIGARQSLLPAAMRWLRAKAFA